MYITQGIPGAFLTSDHHYHMVEEDLSLGNGGSHCTRKSDMDGDYDADNPGYTEEDMKQNDSNEDSEDWQ